MANETDPRTITHGGDPLFRNPKGNKFPFVKDLPEEAQEVVYEMCYQLGLGGFSKFKKTIALLRLGNYEECASEMLDSKWYRQTPNRAQRLSDIIKEL